MSSDYNNETDRLKSFDTWPKPEIDKHLLARIGCYYLKIDDQVKCKFCENVLSDWQTNDDCVKDHFLASPSCPIYRRQAHTNIPIDAAELEKILPEIDYDIAGVTPTLSFYKEYYQKREKRMESFDKWPIGMVTKKTDLVDAGFYYTEKWDCCICYFCGIVIDNWEPNSDPFVEHAKRTQNCHFLNVIKGIDYVKRIQEEEKIKENNEDNEICDQVYICKICLIKRAIIVLRPCGHVVCKICSIDLLECHICRSRITEKRRAIIV